MQLSDVLTFAGDLLVFVGLVLTYVVYRDQRFKSGMQDIGSTVAVLDAVRRGVEGWGHDYFGGAYTEDDVKERSQLDYDDAMNQTYRQILCVPTEPLESLIHQPGEGRLVSSATIEAANTALWRIGIFNQLVQQQTQCYAIHVAQLLDDSLDIEQRRNLAKAAKHISRGIHVGIGNAIWYRELIDALEDNIRDLQSQTRPHWWSRAQADWERG